MNTGMLGAAALAGLTKPQRIGKYEIVDKLGQGAMGVVYRGLDPDLQRPVAVKVIAGSQNDDPGVVLERFRREARMVANLGHPNIVTVYDFGDQDGMLYMVMELLEGDDLATVLRKRDLIGLEEKLGLFEQMCDGIAHAHSKGLVHRDLKPGNVHRSGDGRVKILDFGLARSNEPHLTRAGWILGTPQYMAPEQVRGETADARADVFALGCILYEVLTGERCFPADNVHAAMFQVLEREPRSLRDSDRSLPEILDMMLGKALAKDPEQRFRDGSEVRASIEWLRRVQKGESSEGEALTAMQLRPPGVQMAAGSPSVAAPSMAAPSMGQPPMGQAPMGRTPMGPSAALSAGPTSPPTLARSSAPAGPFARAAAAQRPMSSEARLVFLGEPAGDRACDVALEEKNTLLDLSLGQKIHHYHECGGRGRCSTCRVRVVRGGDNLGPRTPQEDRLARRRGWDPSIRLACQAKVRGDVTVQRLIRDTDDFGLLRLETRQAPPQETAVAILACRLSRFSEASSQLSPYDLVHILNRYFLQIGEPIVACGGQIQHYLSEGLVARFGADGASARDKCLSAVRAALRIRARMADLNHYTRSYFDTELELSVGVHFGRAVVGQVGHPSLLQVTAIGEVPAVASRLCRLGEVAGGGVLASEELINVLEGDIEIGDSMSDLGPHGREINAYELLDFVKADAVLLVQSAFESLARRRDEVAKLFYRLLFELDPTTKPLFEGVDMERQGDMLVDMLAAAVGGLDRLEALKPTVQELGRRHGDYGVQLQHYDSVEQALLETCRQILGDAFTADVRLAWSNVYNQLAQIMIEAGGTDSGAYSMNKPN